MSVTSPDFWIALLQIIGVNIVLSGDNAVVIALASRGLPPHQQKKAIAWGSGAAVIMRILLTIVAVRLLQLPSLKLIGAVLLFWIALQLLLPEHESEDGGSGHSSMFAAIRTILIADLVMSLDNVIAVAAAARDSTLLLIIGLAISIPLVVFASQLLLKLMERFPIIVTLGAALLGWVAGEMLVTDPLIKNWVDLNAHWLHVVVPLAGAIGVVALGSWLSRRSEILRGAAQLAHRVSEAAGTGSAEAAASPATTAAGSGAVSGAAGAAAVSGRAGAAVHAAAPTGSADAQVAYAASHAAPFCRLLVAVDESKCAQQAVKRALGLYAMGGAGNGFTIDLVNIRRPLPVALGNGVTPKAGLAAYRAERSEAAFANVRPILEKAGITPSTHVAVGEPGIQIALLAQRLGSDLIVMGARGLGSFTGRPVGSVTHGTLEHSRVPVLVVR